MLNIPPVKFFACLELEQIILFLGRNYLVSMRKWLISVWALFVCILYIQIVKGHISIPSQGIDGNRFF